MAKVIRIAIPNKGALCAPALEIMKKAGFAALDRPEDTLCARCENPRVEILYVRAQDVAKYVDSGAVYAGITGEDMLLEYSCKARKALDLGFGGCEVALAVPEGSGISSIKALKGKRVATKLPNLARSYLKKCKVNAEIVELSGATEIAPSANLADAIIDQVQTGRTLKSNRLKKIATIARSSAYLIASRKKSAEEEEMLQEILLSIEGVIRAKGLKYLVLNVSSSAALAKVIRVLPSMESPTVLKLAKEGEYALQTVVKSEQLSATIRKVKLAGGKDMLVMPLEKVIA
jgi:ATP phosphoribosyltransferase